MIMKNLITLFACFFSFSLVAQMDTIYFDNPSFEGQPIEGGRLNQTMPIGVIDCGFDGQTAPDIHPVVGGNFSVNKFPAEGKTYLGMVVRDNDTWEQVSVRPTKSLKVGKCYSFSIALARSEFYYSQSQRTNEPANFVTPCILRIWGGNDPCDKNELLGETTSIRNTNWLEYSFIFNPTERYSNIILEAYYGKYTLLPFNGNILLDDMSALIEVDCQNADPSKLMPAKEIERNTSYKPQSKKKAIGIPHVDSYEQFGDATERLMNLKEILFELNELGFFTKGSRENNEEGEKILNELANEIGVDKRFGIDVGIKNPDGKGLRAWRKKYLKNIFLDNRINEYQLDLDKFSRFEKSAWQYETKFMAINIYAR